MLALAVFYTLRYFQLLGEATRRSDWQLNEEGIGKSRLRNAKINFFTMIAHEIHPVTLIIGPGEYHEAGFINPAAIREDLDVIDHRNAHRLLYLVNQLLDFRRSGAEQSR